MDVSRETSPPWVSLCDYISRSLFYKHIFKTNNPSVLKNNPPGATELLFSTNIVQGELGFALIVKGRSRAEKMYLGLSDLFPGHIFYAPSKKTESGRPSLFISEDEKNFESAFAATVFKKPAVIIADTDGVTVVPFNMIDKVINKINRIVEVENDMDKKVANGLKISQSALDLINSDKVVYVD